MTVRRSIGVRNSDARWSQYDGGTARINVYTGAQPATAELAASGTLLGTLTPSSDVFGTPASGAAAMSAVSSDSSADASGTAGWARMYRTGDTAPGSAASATDMRMDFAIGSDIAIDNAAIVAGGVIALSSLTLTETA